MGLAAYRNRIRRLDNQVDTEQLALVVRPAGRRGYVGVDYMHKGKRFSAAQLDSWPAQVVCLLPDGGAWMKDDYKTVGGITE